MKIYTLDIVNPKEEKTINVRIELKNYDDLSKTDILRKVITTLFLMIDNENDKDSVFEDIYGLYKE